MKNNKLGCFSSTAIISSIITLVVIVGVGIAQGGAMFSPGELNAQAGSNIGGVTSHAELGTKCSSCHVPFWGAKTMADRCLDCHTDIQEERQQDKSLHGALNMSGDISNCGSCHLEHRGSSAPLTETRGVNINHTPMGFSLLAHEDDNDLSLDCRDCHRLGYETFDQTSCTDCHTEIDAAFMTAHTLSYGNDCQACHDGIDTYGHSFNHANTPFALTGKHTETICTKCHINARNMTDLKSTAQDCLSCHRKDEPHGERFGLNCAECHTTDGWSPAEFDHDLARFKLEGEHVSVECIDCHTDGNYEGTPTTCFACHSKDDEHNGRFGENCSACHTPQDWEGAEVDHDLFAFKLTGAHINTECTNCHINGLFQGTPASCYDCHSADDNHSGSFGTACSACHTTSAWKPATFDHRLSGFPLTGGHARVTCAKCHTQQGIFSGLSNTCASCHGDPAYHRGLFGANCASCHNTNNWAAKYNGPHPSPGIHHEGASCNDCHTINLLSATCTRCHDSNNPQDDD